MSDVPMVRDLDAPFDIEGYDFAFDDIPNPHELIAAARARKPYAIVPFLGTRAVMFLTHDLVSAAFKDEESFPASAIYSATTEPVLGHTIQCMRGAEHRINRKVVVPAFRRKIVTDQVEAILEPLAHELVDRFEARGEADLVTEFTHGYPVQVITRLLGLPVDDEERFRRWAVDLFHFPMAPDAAERASREFTEYVTPIVARRRIDPGEDLLSTLAGTEAEGRRLTDEEILSFLRLLFPAGADTTYLALGNALYALLTHPEQLARVLADPDTEPEWAVEESLRWEPPVGLLPRICPAPVRDWQGLGLDIPAETPLIFAITAANRDPAHYPNPDVFDIGRRVRPTLAFGDGPHVCLGTWLALAEIRAALKVLLQRLPTMRLAEPTRIRGLLGTALRGPESLRVRFDR
ncbi:cytochrome P450 [Embleya sp. NBC_00888]|uniref:cytochrome P450 n=1 Tax=Embleya sp. NBC_00888 TaxID=2975960 RepID=UPI00386B5C9C|nr:cytochrome P450 [Embleya sp. NBC_00888]